MQTFVLLLATLNVAFGLYLQQLAGRTGTLEVPRGIFVQTGTRTAAGTARNLIGTPRTFNAAQSLLSNSGTGSLISAASITPRRVTAVRAITPGMESNLVISPSRRFNAFPSGSSLRYNEILAGRTAIPLSLGTNSIGGIQRTAFTDRNLLNQGNRYLGQRHTFIPTSGDVFANNVDIGQSSKGFIATVKASPNGGVSVTPLSSDMGIGSSPVFVPYRGTRTTSSNVLGRSGISGLNAINIVRTPSGILSPFGQRNIITSNGQF